MVDKNNLIQAWEYVKIQHETNFELNLYHTAYNRYSAAVMLTQVKTDLWKALQEASQIHTDGLKLIHDHVAKVFFENQCPGGQMPILYDDPSYVHFFERTWPPFWISSSKYLLYDDAFTRWLLETTVLSEETVRKASIWNAVRYARDQITVKQTDKAITD